MTKELEPATIERKSPRPIAEPSPVRKALFAENYAFEVGGVHVATAMHRHGPIILSNNGTMEEIAPTTPVYVTLSNGVRLHEVVVPAIRIINAIAECLRLKVSLDAWEQNKDISDADARLLDLAVSAYAPRQPTSTSSPVRPEIDPWNVGHLFSVTTSRTTVSLMLSTLERSRAEMLTAIGQRLGWQLDPWARYDIARDAHGGAVPIFSRSMEGIYFLSEGGLPAFLRRAEAMSWVLGLGKKEIEFQDVELTEQRERPRHRDNRTKRNEETARFLELIEHLVPGLKAERRNVPADMIALALDMTPDYDISGAQVAVRSMVMFRKHEVRYRETRNLG